MPEQHAGGVGVESINAVVLCRDEDNIARCLAWDAQAGNIKRLRIDLAVDTICEQLAERGGIHVRGAEEGFFEIRARTRIIVVISQDVHLGQGAESAVSKKNSENSCFQQCGHAIDIAFFISSWPATQNVGGLEGGEQLGLTL